MTEVLAVITGAYVAVFGLVKGYALFRAFLR